MNTQASPETARNGRGPRLGRGQHLGWLTLVALAFVAGLGLARVLWHGPTPAADVVEAPATPTSIPPTPALLPTPTATSPENRDDLPTLYIEIAPDDFARIEAKREEALKTWILLTGSEDLVPATVQLGDADPVAVRLRLKGDWGDHFAHQKWSYRVEVRDGGSLMGMRVLSLQDPSTRSYVDEWTFLQSLRDEDVLSVGYGFVHVVQNGQYMGIYAVEEGFSKELLESQGRRESVIIRYNEDLLWEYWSSYDNDLVTPLGVRKFHIIDEFETGAVNADPALSARRDVAVGKLRAWWAGDLLSSEVFDTELTARFWALADLWGARHVLQWHNLRYYYNPVTTLLEPIAFDAQPLAGSGGVSIASLPGRRALLASGDARLQRAYVESLWEFTEPAYLASLQERYAADLALLNAAMLPEFGEEQMTNGREALAAPWEVLSERRASLRDLLQPVQMTYAYRSTQVPTDTLWLDVGNLLAFPVQILGVQIGEAWFPADASWGMPDSADLLVAAAASGDDLVLKPLSADATFMPYARMRTAVTLPEDYATQEIGLVTRIWGLPVTVTRPVASAYPAVVSGPLPSNPTAAEALASHTFLSESSHSQELLTVSPGTHTVTGDLIIPEGFGLEIGPGTTLSFGPDNYLLARGPLYFYGTESAPVVLRPSGEQWRGIVVLSAGDPSQWENVIVEDTAAIDVPGWTLTGGITFYRSPISLDRCRILGTRAEDGLNAIQTYFEFTDTEFADSASDAFDADFSQGAITRSTFHDIGADAIDVSGSQVRVSELRLVSLGDKGLSVGEASEVTAEGISVEEADFGIVSKDLSHVVAADVTLSGIRVAGLAAYIKKPVYGPATIVADGVRFDEVPSERMTLVQTGSWIDLDGVRIWGADVDVDALYNQ